MDLKDGALPPSTPLKLSCPLLIPDNTPENRDDTIPVSISMPKGRVISPGTPVMATGRVYLDTENRTDSLIEITVEDNDGFGQLIPGTMLTPLTEDELELFDDGNISALRTRSSGAASYNTLQRPVAMQRGAETSEKQWHARSPTKYSTSGDALKSGRSPLDSGSKIRQRNMPDGAQTD